MGRTEGPDSVPSRSNRDRDRRGPRSTQSRTVLISKALSRLLRHQAQNEGVPITSDGWVRLDHLFAWRGFSSRNGVTPLPTVDEIWEVVEENEKKRFAVRWLEDVNVQKTNAALPSKAQTEASTELLEKTGELVVAANDLQGQGAGQENTTQQDHEYQDADMLSPTDEATDSETNQAIKAWRSGLDTTQSHYLIRATQGHSIKAITSTTDLMRPITLADPSSIPSTCAHGTFYGSWPLILRSGGLKPMGRNHVHFAAGPALSEVLPHGDASDAAAGEKPKVISGMRHDAQILIYIDLRQCLEDVKARNAEMEWWRSENGVILTAGVDPALVEVDGEAQAEAGETTTASQSKSSTAELERFSVAGPETAADDNKSGNWKQKNRALQSKGLDAKLVPMKYWIVVVEIKRGLGVLWRQGQGVVRDLPPELLAMGTPKGPRGGGKGGRRGRGGWRG